MRKFFTLISIAFIAFSCSNEIISSVKDDNTKSISLTVLTAGEQENETKVSIDNSDVYDSTWSLSWNESDALTAWVDYDFSLVKFSMSSYDASASRFVGDVNANAENIRLIYPYDSAVTATDSLYPIDISSQINGASSLYLISEDLFAVTSENDYFTQSMKHVGAFIVLNVDFEDVSADYTLSSVSMLDVPVSLDIDLTKKVDEDGFYGESTIGNIKITDLDYSLSSGENGNVKILFNALPFDIASGSDVSFKFNFTSGDLTYTTTVTKTNSGDDLSVKRATHNYINSTCSCANLTEVPAYDPTLDYKYGNVFINADDYYARKISKFFLDIKMNASAVGGTKKATAYFVTDNMNGIRMSIYGDDSHPAHPSEGVIIDSYYTSMIASVNRAKTARGDNEFIIFASKKLDGKNSFPDWVMASSGVGVDYEKYTQLLVDYILYMEEQDIIIDVLGIDNEYEWNEGYITAYRHSLIVKLLREKSVEYGFKMPLIVGPERYEPQGDVTGGWMKTMFANNYDTTLDIYGMHHYPQYRSSYYDKLVYELELKGDREFWATEPHWDDNSAANADMLDHSELAICTFWDQIDLGMDMFCWWDYNYDDLETQRGSLMREVSVPLLYSQPITVDDVDGREIFDTGKLQTRAFRNGNTINLFVINMTPIEDKESGTSYKDYEFLLMGYNIDGAEVECMQWSDESATTGDVYTTEVLYNRMFKADIPVRSITRFTFDIYVD